MNASKNIKFWCFTFQKSLTSGMSRNKKLLNDIKTPSITTEKLLRTFLNHINSQH